MSGDRDLEIGNHADEQDGFNALFDALIIPASITTLKEGRFINVNEEYVRFFGFSREELIGRTLFELNMIVDPQKRSELVDELGKKGAAVNAEYELRTRSGEVRTMLMSLKAIQASGHKCGFALLMDATPQKQVEKELSQSRQRLSLALEGARLGTWEWDLSHGCMNGWNQRMYELFQLDKDEHDLTARALERIHPKDRKGFHRDLEQSAARGRLDCAVRIVRNRRRIVWVRLCGNWIAGQAGGGPGHIIGIGEDITAHKEYERILKKSKTALEKKVAERTSELNSRNLELQHLFRKYKEMSQKIMQVLERDRKALSRELHDSIGGTLAAIMYSLESRIGQMKQQPPGGAISFERVNEHLLNTIRETRRIAKQLRPAALDDFGLAAAIREMLSDFREFYPHIDVCSHMAIQERSLSDDIKIVLFRVAQEAMHNVGRHSRARHVDVVMKNDRKMARLLVTDDGCGFDFESLLAARRTSSFGLNNMKDRIEICRGTFQIESSPGKGTSLKVGIPLGPAPDGVAADRSAAQDP